MTSDLTHDVTALFFYRKPPKLFFKTSRFRLIIGDRHFVFALSSAKVWMRVSSTFDTMLYLKKIQTLHGSMIQQTMN